MQKRHGKYCWLALAAGALSLVILFGCASQKPIWGDPKSGIALTYRAEEGSVWKYNSQVRVVQDMATMGQKNESRTDLV